MILDNEAIPPNRAPLGERLQAHLDSAMFLALLAMVFFIPFGRITEEYLFCPEFGVLGCPNGTVS